MTTRNPSGHWCQDETATVVNGKWCCTCPQSAPRREMTNYEKAITGTDQRATDQLARALKSAWQQ